MRQLPTLPSPPTGMRVLFGVAGVGFAGVGIVVLVYLWFGDDAPPFIFRAIGSVIACMFVAFGVTMAASFIRPRSMLSLGGIDPSASGASQPPQPATGYTCPSCSATLGKEAEVSPMGDVKCSFCGRWFNIHNRV